MSVNELKVLLDEVQDTRELVLRRGATWAPVHDAWDDAREDADDGLLRVAERAHRRRVHELSRRPGPRGRRPGRARRSGAAGTGPAQPPPLRTGRVAGSGVTFASICARRCS